MVRVRPRRLSTGKMGTRGSPGKRAIGGEGLTWRRRIDVRLGIDSGVGSLNLIAGDLYSPTAGVNRTATPVETSTARVSGEIRRTASGHSAVARQCNILIQVDRRVQDA